MQIETFERKAKTIAKLYPSNTEKAKDEILKIAKGDGFDYTETVDAILAPYMGVRSPIQQEVKPAEAYALFPSAFVEQNKYLKVIKRGDNRTIADYDEQKKHYIEYSDEEAKTRIHNMLVKNGLQKFCTIAKLRDTLSNVKDTLHCEGREIDGAPSQQYINFKNGLLDTKTFEIVPHTHEHYTSAQSPYDIDLSKTECPIWLEYLQKIAGGDGGIITLLQEAMGYCIFGQDIQLQSAFFLYSPETGTGKSTFLQVLRSLVGVENTSSLSLEKMVTGNSILKSLLGKRVNINDELGTKYMESSVISAIISGEDITFDVKYKDPITTNFGQTRFIFSTNQLPNFNAAFGMERRTIIIPFFYRFVAEPDELIVDFHKYVLEHESGAILNWAIDGYKRIKETKRFTIPEASRFAANEYKKTIDAVAAYLGDHDNITESFKGKWATARDFYGEPNDRENHKEATGFIYYCYRYGYRNVLNFHSFSQRMLAYVNQNKDEYETRINGGYRQYRLVSAIPAEDNNEAYDATNTPF